MHVFGLTGGIASGKSAVAARFRERGVPVIDADELAREVVAPGSDGLALVAAEFGADVLAADGSLDRKKVAARVFGDKDKLTRLNAITHPRIAALSARRTAELAGRGEPLACYEAALIVENGARRRVSPARRRLGAARGPSCARDAHATSRTTLRCAPASRAAAARREGAARPTSSSGTTAPSTSCARAPTTALDDVCRRVGLDPARYARPAVV